MHWRNLAVVSGLALVASALIPVAVAVPAGATSNPPIVVTTTADVIDGGDGLVSLREAVALANATVGTDTVLLADGATYNLTICGDDSSPDNSKGDLDGTDLAGLILTGNPADVAPPVIHQTCNQRVVFGSSGPLTIAHLHLTGGVGIDGGSILAHGPLVMDHADVSGVVGLAGDAAVFATTRPVSISDSAIHDNSATGLIITGSGTRAGAVIQRSSIRNNTMTGNFDAAGIVSLGSFTLDHSEVTGNAGGQLAGGIRSFDAYVTNSDISGNSGAPHAGGIQGGFTLIDSTLNDNIAGTGGTGLGGGGDGRFTLIRTTVSGNHAGFAAGGLSGQGTITDSTVSGNTATGAAGGIFTQADPTGPTPSLTITRSTVTGNTGHVAGGILVMDDWSSSGGTGLVHPASVVVTASTLAGNTATPNSPPPDDPPRADDLAFSRWSGEAPTNVAGNLTATASVFGDGVGATPACRLAPASPVTSGGYNFSADSSCVSGGTGDLSAGGDPGLSPLADNGGPTQTMMPSGTSPLVDRIPSAFSTCGGTLDQRGVARPVGPACTIGAVEADRIVVTTAADVIDPSDGLLSLREAVARANATPGDDTIVLADGATYDLSICGSAVNDAPDNTIGDLDATDTASLTIEGSSAAATPPTITQTCPQRVLYSGVGALDLAHVRLTGGTAATGASITAVGPLTLDHVDESGATTVGTSTWDSAAVDAQSRPVSITDSVVHDNAGAGLYLKDAGPSTSSIVLRTTVRDNAASAQQVAGGIWSPGAFTLDQSTITGNTGGLLAAGVAAFGSSAVTHTTLSGNHDGKAGGIAGELSLTDSQVIGNSGTIYGGIMGRFAVTRSTVSGNHSGQIGGGLTGSGTITDSTLSGNDAVGAGGGVFAEPGDAAHTSLVVSRSTITGNTGAVAGGILAVDDYDFGHPVPVPPADKIAVVVESSTIVGNVVVAGLGGVPLAPATVSATDIAFARFAAESPSAVVGSLTVTSSVLGSGGSSTTACATGPASPVSSGGYDFSADGSCISGGTGDVVAGGDPGLSPLGDHGGSTPTMVPTVGSPLLDRIPSGFSSCAGQVDQRGVARPVGAACDVGSVEADGQVFPTEREFTPLVPQRLMDTRSDPAYHVGSQHRFGPGETQSLVVAGGSSPVPVDASAVVVNVTAVGPDDSSHVDVWPTGTSQPNVSNLNFVPGQTVPNLVKVKVGAGGKISLFNRNGHVDVIVDVVGYYRADPTAARYTPVVPKRIADTRSDPAYHVGSMTRLGDHTDVRSLTVTGGTTGVPVGAKAVIANVTVVGPSANSHLDVWPDGTSHPNVSNLNYVAGQTVANLVVVKVSAGGKIDLVNANGSTDVIVDIVGYFTVDPTATGFVAVSPRRLADTRSDPAYHVGSQGRLGDHFDTRGFVVTGGTVPTDAKAIVANITVVGPSTASHLDVWPAGTVHPNVSNINYVPGQTAPNLVTVKIGPGGVIDLQNQNGSTDVIIDIVGYYR